MSQHFEDINVMVVDDSKTIRKTAEVLLQKSGYKVSTANDGFDALAKISENKPNILFLDVMMPRLDGYETCAIIRGNEQFSGIPIVMLSSKSGFCDKAKSVAAGADHYITKPFSKDDLITAIATHVK